MKTHVCEECGHEIKFNGELRQPVEHKPDGSHRWSVTLTTTLTAKGFGGKDA